MDLAPGAALPDSPRPHPGWYVVAALIAAGGLLVVAAVLFLTPWGGDLGQRIPPGQAVTVHVPATGKMVWTAGALDIADLQCEPTQWDALEGLGWGMISVREDNLTLDVDGRRWHGAMLVTASQAGTYSVTCTTSGAAVGTSLAIGDPPWLRDAGTRGAVILGAALLAVLGVVIGCGLAVLVAVRRRHGHHRSGSEPW